MAIMEKNNAVIDFKSRESAAELIKACEAYQGGPLPGQSTLVKEPSKIEEAHSQSASP